MLRTLFDLQLSTLRRQYQHGLVVVSLLMTTLAAATTVQAQGLPGASTGRQWAILIGVEHYKLAPPLSYTINDVDTLAATLRERGGVEARHIVKFVDSASEERSQPLLSSLMKRAISFRLIVIVHLRWVQFVNMRLLFTTN